MFCDLREWGDFVDVYDKLKILTDAAKYDAACTSSGVDRNAAPGGIGNATACGICHTFAADGRCISLLKVLFTNACMYDCKYCVNRRSNDTPRAAFTPEELADLTIEFYRRNYIEGLFVSSGVVKNPDYTCELLIKCLRILREKYKFSGYIHTKMIPGASPDLIEQLGLLADRTSVNIELPSQNSLSILAPDKSKKSILAPMSYVTQRIEQNSTEIVKYRNTPKFSPAGQATQMIIGATPDSDYQILSLTQSLYKHYGLRRVFFSAYMPVVENKFLPALDVRPPLLREHRLYQADFLLRQYGFTANEILCEDEQNLNLYVDPKCQWALRHLDQFPVEINKANYNELLKIPGIGPTSAKRIMISRSEGQLDFPDLKKLGVVLKRAKFFCICKGKRFPGLQFSHSDVLFALMSPAEMALYRQDFGNEIPNQLSFLQ